MCLRKRAYARKCENYRFVLGEIQGSIKPESNELQFSGSKLLSDNWVQVIFTPGPFQNVKF